MKKSWILLALLWLCLPISAVAQFTLSTDINPSLVGQTITLTASGTPAFTTATFYDGGSGGTVLGSATNNNDGPDVVSIQVSTLTQGVHSLVACYPFSGPVCSNTVSQTVNNPPPPPPVYPVLSSSPNPSTAADAVTLSATSVPYGTVATFYDGGTGGSVLGASTADSSNTATLVTTALSPGTHTLVACYQGSALLCSNNVTQVVTSAPASLTLTSTPNPSAEGETVNLTASLAPSGVTVFFLDGGSNGSVLGSAPGPVATLAVTGLSTGSHTLVACYGSLSSGGSFAPQPLAVSIPFANFATCSNTVIQVVGPTGGQSSLTLSSSVNPSAPCQAVTFTATVTAGSSGTVSFFDGTTSLGTVPLSAATASVTVSSLTPGSHLIQARFNPNSGQASSAILTQTVTGTSTLTLGSAPNPSNPGQTVVMTATAGFGACTGVTAPTGSVQFFDGSVLLGTSNLASGTATFSTAALAVGSHPLKAVYLGDQNFGGSTSAIVVQVVTSVIRTDTTTVLTGSSNPLQANQPLTLTATVTPSGATGTVQFMEGGAVIGTKALSGGTASFTIPNLSPGPHSLSAFYPGDTNFNASTSNVLSVNVTTATATTTTLAASPDTPAGGQPLTLTATVSPSAAAGQVQFKDGGALIGTVNLSGGTAALTIPSLSGGSHSFVASYLGNTNFLPSTSNTITTTVATPTTTTLAASPGTPLGGQPLTLTATVSPSAAPGQVQFKDGGALIGTVSLSGGTATLTIPSLSGGSHSFVASYLGNTNFLPSTSNAITTSVQGPSTTTLSADPNPATPGQTVTLTASVSPGNATGTVQFFDNGTAIGQGTLSGGTATFPFVFTSGSHTLTARYGGDSATLPSVSNAVTLAVNRTPTTTTLSASATQIVSGQPFTLTASVSPSGATGQVQFRDGGSVLATVTLNGGTASFTSSTLPTGNHSFSAAYLGSATFEPSTSGILTLSVQAPNTQSTTTSLSAAPNPIDVGGTTILRAVVTPGNVTGTVSFLDGGFNLGEATIVNGVATFPAAGLTAGSHTIVAAFAGDSTFSPSASSPVTVVVNGSQSRVTLTVTPNPAAFGQTVTMTATVAGTSSGNPPGGSVTFKDGSTELAVVPVSGGSATFSTATLVVGTHPITAVYSGDSTFGTSTAGPVNLVVGKATTATSLTATPANSNPGDPVVLSAKVTSTSKGAITGTVTFLDGGVALAPPVPVVTGGASFTTSTLTVGTHTLTAVYSGDANNLASTSPAASASVGVTGTTTTLGASPTSANFGQQVSLTATVAPAEATGIVTFLDGGAAIGSGTLSGGTAVFHISSLTAGPHTLTARYEGDSKFGTSTSAAVTVTIGKGSSTISLNVSPSPVLQGQPLGLSAVVTPSGATGTVTFLDGGTSIGTGSLNNGTATFSTSSLAVGTHSLTAVYGGDGNNTGSTAAAVTLVVNSATPLGNISPSSLPAGIVGVPYASQTFTVSGGAGQQRTWTVVSGLTFGLTLSPGGVLGGTPTSAGSNALTVRVDDGSGSSATIVVTLTVLALPSLSVSAPVVSSTADQPTPQVVSLDPFSLPLTATFTLSFVPNASNLPANFTNSGVKFIGGGTVSPAINIPANSTAPISLPAIQVGSVAGTIMITLTSLTTGSGQSVLPANPPTGIIQVGRMAPSIVPGSVKIMNVTSTGFSVFLDGVSTTRDLLSATLTFTAAAGTTLNGAQFTIDLTSFANAWFVSNGGVANGGAFSLTIPFNFSGDPAAIGSVSVTLTNAVGTSGPATGGK